MPEDTLAPLGLPTNFRSNPTTSVFGNRLRRIPTDHLETSVQAAEDDHGHPAETPWPSRRPSESGTTAVPSERSLTDETDRQGGDGVRRDVSESAPNAGEKRRRGTGDLEKGARGNDAPAFGGGGALQRKRTSRNEEVPKDPETRAWKDNIVTFDSKSDPTNPKNWSTKHKYAITSLYGMTTLSATFASSVFSSAGPFYGRQFGVGTEVQVLGTSLFILGYVFGPLIWSAVSETYGRKLSIFPAMICFIAFTCGTAVAKDVQTIFITRFFAGLMASAPVTTVGGALADMFDQRERGTAVVVYSLAVVAGPTLGPIIGGAVSQSYLGWRWTAYLIIILASTVSIVGLFFIPETYTPVLLTKKARNLRLKTGRWELHSQHEMVERNLGDFLSKNLLLPLRMIASEPMVTAITLYNGFTYGILYLLFGAVPIFFEETRGWNSLVGALPFLSVLMGCFAAAAINACYSQFYFVKQVDKHGGHVKPELRLPPMMIGSTAFPVGFFIIGWTSRPDIFWFGQIVGLFLIGMSFLLIFQGGMNYLIDSYTKRSASAVAANTFVRSIFAVGLPFAAAPLVHNIGIDWGCTLLGCVALLLGGLPFLFYKYGPHFRRRSPLVEDF